ncbi:Sensor kinase CusS [Luteitalea pratensis]|uniref:histidine kinase n=1 Tax=Luteitalea pratensis TaxID=1855912 RepID=A0A143PMZ5_LUTPR|nr:ATP-binding protein [Luteitalea pratensis]AMY09851.1 Sensor kinase CusS [Luteitalea pratensis]
MRIRTRLAIWSGLITFVCLVSTGAAVLWLHGRLALAQIDERLGAATVAVAGVLRHELDEGLPLDGAVRDTMSELTLARESFAIVAADGAVIGAKAATSPRLADETLRAGITRPSTVDAGAGQDHVRLLSAPFPTTTASLRIVSWASLGPIATERQRLALAMLLGIPIAVVLSIIGGLGVGRRTLASLSDLASQAGAIDGRDLTSRLTLHQRDDELASVAASFNGVLERLSASVRQQRAFMAEASHQLRTPVSVIRTTAEVTLDQPTRSEGEYRESFDVIGRQARRLTRMVDDMFVLALADASARPLQVSHLYLDELVDDVVDDYRVLAASCHVAIRSDSDGDAPFAGDEHLLRQMLMNLVDNALRHTPGGGSVGVSLHRVNGSYQLQVSDTGPGIPAADVDRIFDRFVRLAAPGSEGGGGLGLPIARWIAEAHGGTLVLGPTSPDGTWFLATLPVPSPPVG